MIVRRRRTALGAAIQSPTYEQKLTMLLAVGGVAGIILGKIGFDMFFVDGITSEERKNMIVFAAGMGLWWGLDKAFDLQKQLYLWENQAAQAVGIQTGDAQ
jgi:hypothetical protein